MQFLMLIVTELLSTPKAVAVTINIPKSPVDVKVAVKLPDTFVGAGLGAMVPKPESFTVKVTGVPTGGGLPFTNT